jgi:DNA-directed RNA polymerase subunit M/transcription elongation factor TFIIS
MKICHCGKPVENKDTGLCGTCNRNSRKISTQKKPYLITKRSSKQKERDKRILNAYKVVDKLLPPYCGNCGKPEFTHSHILPRGQYPDHADNVVNIFHDCIACHYIWEHGSLEQVKAMRDWPKRLSVIKKLAPEYIFRRFSILITEIN